MRRGRVLGTDANAWDRAGRAKSRFERGHIRGRLIVESTGQKVWRPGRRARRGRGKRGERIRAFEERQARRSNVEAAEGRSSGTLGTAAYMIVCGDSVADSESGASMAACWFRALRRMFAPTTWRHGLGRFADFEWTWRFDRYPFLAGSLRGKEFAPFHTEQNFGGRPGDDTTSVINQCVCNLVSDFGTWRPLGP